MSEYREISHCRICGNPDLISILDLGNQALTGVFPKTKSEDVLRSPLEIVKCQESDGKSCGLVQLRHSLPLNRLYGDHYGYRSGLNASMVAHLHGRVKKVLQQVSLGAGDLVIDIGSNDGTLLGAYLKAGVSQAVLLGVDPLSAKFRKYYAPGIQSIADFFSAELVLKQYGNQKAKVITSLAMFYDLEEPLEFMRQIRSLLHRDGIWVFEQSYLPTMLRQNSYDTICHEHLEYYALKQIHWMTLKAGLKILDVEFNDTNGGSFAVTVSRDDSSHTENKSLVQSILSQELREGIGTIRPYEEFREHILKTKEVLMDKLKRLKKDGKKVFGYGASTKGNVILQFCGVTENELPYIMEVNPEKFGSFTPGTKIPIISETEARAMKPDYVVPLPWHFRKFILEKETKYLAEGGKILFPLPNVETVESGGRK